MLKIFMQSGMLNCRGEITAADLIVVKQRIFDQATQNISFSTK